MAKKQMLLLVSNNRDVTIVFVVNSVSIHLLMHISSFTRLFSIEISQLWSNDADISVFVHYHTEKHGSVCEEIPGFS